MARLVLAPEGDEQQIVVRRRDAHAVVESYSRNLGQDIGDAASRDPEQAQVTISTVAGDGVEHVERVVFGAVRKRDGAAVGRYAEQALHLDRRVDVEAQGFGTS